MCAGHSPVDAPTTIPAWPKIGSRYVCPNSNHTGCVAGIPPCPAYGAGTAARGGGGRARATHKSAPTAGPSTRSAAPTTIKRRSFLKTTRTRIAKGRLHGRPFYDFLASRPRSGLDAFTRCRAASPLPALPRPRARRAARSRCPPRSPACRRSRGRARRGRRPPPRPTRSPRARRGVAPRSAAPCAALLYLHEGGEELLLGRRPLERGGGHGRRRVDLDLPVALQARRRRDQLPDDDVLLQPQQRVVLALDRRVGEHLRRLLERRGGEEGLRGERRLRDPE